MGKGGKKSKKTRFDKDTWISILVGFEPRTSSTVGNRLTVWLPFHFSDDFRRRMEHRFRFAGVRLRGREDEVDRWRVAAGEDRGRGGVQRMSSTGCGAVAESSKMLLSWGNDKRIKWSKGRSISGAIFGLRMMLGSVECSREIKVYNTSTLLT